MIILLAGLKMLGGQLGQHRRASKAAARTMPQPKRQVILPLITGAGAISTVILFEQMAPDLLHVGTVFAAVALCSAFARMRAQVISMVDRALYPVCATTMPRSVAASPSMAALRVPVDAISFRCDKRSRISG
jgi:small neutral amino acid transporter SnatA (MarC family)